MDEYIKKGLKRELRFRKGLIKKAERERDWYTLKVELARVRILEARLEGREVGIPQMG